MIVERKEIRVVPDSISRLINGTGENGQPGVAEIHAGLSSEDVSAIQNGEAKLVAAIIENGISIIEEPQPPIPPIPPDNPIPDDGHIISEPVTPSGGKPQMGTPKPPISGDDHLRGNPISSSGIGLSPDPSYHFDPVSRIDSIDGLGDNHSSDTQPDNDKDDDDDRRTILGIPLIKKIIGIGSAIGLTLLLSQCDGINIPSIGNPFIDVHEEHHIEQSDVYQVNEIADLYFESDEYLRGSQVRSPGELIDELRNAGWAEQLGREEGRAEYDARDGEDRARDEQYIQNINRQFEEQTQIIQDNRFIIEDPSSTPEQVEQAIKAIQTAKSIQRGLYDEFSPVFERYFEEAVSAVQDPSDDRTDDEVEEYAGIYAQYQDGRENLSRDVDKVSGIIETYLHPEKYEDVFFDKSAEERFDAEDKGPVINTLESIGPFGHREVVESTVTSELDADPNSSGQVHEGVIDITQAREVTVTETRVGISALFHKIGDFFSEIGKTHETQTHESDQHVSSPSTQKAIEDEER